jgi:acyl-ACP thioesterase
MYSYNTKVRYSETGHPTKIIQENQKGYKLEDRLDMTYLSRKIIMPAEYNSYEEFRVKKCHLDTNNHVNNTKYVQMTEEYLPEGIMIKHMRAEYKKPVVYNDIVVPKVEKEDDKYVMELGNQNNTVYEIVEFV